MPTSPHASEFDARAIDHRVRLAMRILEFEQTKVPAIEELAARVGMSKFHFSRLFRAQIGESSSDYSRRIRLDHSNNRLLHDPAPISVVAESFGYENQAAFNRAYLRQFGLPPRRFVNEVLGRRPADYVTAQLGLEREDEIAWPLLRDTVRVVTTPARPAVARRFFGHDIAGHWRRFLAELPPGVIDQERYAGMTYDNARVTPARHWRYDCAIILDRVGELAHLIDARAGLDPVELPGGIHAQVAVSGDFGDVRRATVGLFAEWLREHHEYQPEGDPVVHLLQSRPTDTRFDAVATIRLHERGISPAPNLRPLTRRGRPAGHRTHSTAD